MNYEIQLTAKAEDDLRSIYKYIAVNLQSAGTASALLDRLELAIDSLAQMPERFKVYGSEPWRSRNLRIMPIENYLVFYIPDNKTATVTVIRVMYGARDVDIQLMKL